MSTVSVGVRAKRITRVYGSSDGSGTRTVVSPKRVSQRGWPSRTSPPGKPMMAGRLGGAVVLGLPGNPVSAFVTALLFVRPVIARLAGAADPLPRTRTAILGEDLPANGPRADHLRAEYRDGRVWASTVQDSSMLLTLARSTCLIVRPPHASAARAGDSAEILDLG